MSDVAVPPDPKSKANRPQEPEAVRMTIVGGRPPGVGRKWETIPRGIEVLVKKASVDSQFKTLLLSKRAEAAREIDLALDRAEVAMLNSVPAAQLEAIIARTNVDLESRAAFLGRAAALMLAALGVDRTSADDPTDKSSAQPNAPGNKQTAAESSDSSQAKPSASEKQTLAADGKTTATSGAARDERPRRFVTQGIPPDPPPIRGIQPLGVPRWRRYK